MTASWAAESGHVEAKLRVAEWGHVEVMPEVLAVWQANLRLSIQAHLKQEQPQCCPELLAV